ncbi:MAG: cyclopropane-fatty-acyl-phospholipid synthase family protein [Pseudomonadota bacterium]
MSIDYANGDKTDTIELRKDNLSEALQGLPRQMALALRAVTLLKKGSIELTVPGGRTFTYSGELPGPHGVATLNNWRLPRRVITAGSLGVSEGYLAGDWDSPDVTAFLELFLVNSTESGAEQFFDRGRFLKWLTTLHHWFNRNTKKGSKRNIAAHYDLGNAFYEQWLDPSMTYSSAWYGDGANSLEEAQEAKYRSLSTLCDIKPDHHVLEIGCGWGGFAEHVAGRIGAKITCLTISQEQYDFAQARMQRLGLNDKVTIKFQDYRDETGTYDRIGSIEMFEAVGAKYWDTYFQKLHDCLKPQGKAGVQVITIKNQDFEGYRDNPDFIQKYIFPGGMLPSDRIMEELGPKNRLSLVDSLSFGHDYGETLAQWRERFWAAWPSIEPLGFDERFKRMWEYYLHYCEAGFRTNGIDVRQMIYQRG